MRKVLQTALSAGLIALSGAAFAQSGGSGSSGSGATGTSPSEGGATMERSPSSEGATGSGAAGSGAGGSAGTTGGATASAPPQDAVGKSVYSAQGEQIGEIEAIEGNQVIVSVGGFLGMGDHKVALPWDQMSMSGSGEEARITTSMTEDQLKSLPEYKEGESGSGGTSGGMGGSSGGTQ